MKTGARKTALFAILISLQMVLGIVDRSIPISTLPGIRLGLANTVVLYAIYAMDRKSAFLLVMIKVITAGILSGSVTSMICSLSGGLLSFFTMILVYHNKWTGAVAGWFFAAAVEAFLLIRFPNPDGEILQGIIVTGAALVAGILMFAALKYGKLRNIPGTSMAGGITHNIGQVAAVAMISHTPGLMTVYLPLLIGTGAAVGFLTGIIAERVLHILNGTEDKIR